MMFKDDKIGLIGDLHFGKHSSVKWDDVYTELKEWIIETFKGKTTQLMFLGDIFDGRLTKANEKGVTFKSLDFVDKFFDDLTAEFEIYTFAGNHDCYYKNGNADVSGLSLLRNKPKINVIEDTTDIEHEKKIYRIVPWSCDLGDTKVDTIFAHFDIQNFRLNAHKVSEHGYTSKELFEVCDGVYSGHYHHTQENTYQNKTKKIKYLGTPLQLDWGEAGKDSYVYLFDLNNNIIEEEFENKVSPKHVRILASELEKKAENFKGNTITDIVWDLEDGEVIDESLLEGCFSSRVDYSKIKDKYFEDIKTNISSADPSKVMEEYLDGSDIDGEKKNRVLVKAKTILKMVV